MIYAGLNVRMCVTYHVRAWLGDDGRSRRVTTEVAASVLSGADTEQSAEPVVKTSVCF
jgi:hypothetical protein